MELKQIANIKNDKKMKEVQAYQCDYCGKIFEQEKSCHSHEYRCYFNPRTRSCASCAFNRIEIGQIVKTDVHFQFISCMMNMDIPKVGLQTKCPKYLDKKYIDDVDIMSEVRKQYNPQKIMESYVEKNPKIFDPLNLT